MKSVSYTHLLAAWPGALVRRAEPRYARRDDGVRPLVDAGPDDASGRDLPGYGMRMGRGVDGVAVAGSEAGAGEVFAVSGSVV